MAKGWFFTEEQTPQAIDAKRELIKALSKDNLSASPVQHWTQALSRVLGAGADGYETAKLNEADKAGTEKWIKALSNLPEFGGGVSPTAMPSAGAALPASQPAPATPAVSRETPPGFAEDGTPMPPVRPSGLGIVPADAPLANRQLMAGASPVLPTASFQPPQQAQAAPSVPAPAAPPANRAMAFAPIGPANSPMPSLVRSESGGNWQAQNNAMGAGGMPGHFGRLQFGQARLQDAMNAGVIPPGTTPQQFMASPELQRRAEQWHFADIDRAIASGPAAQAIGRVINGVPITQDGLRAVAHLGGVGGMNKFVQTNGAYNPADANGTTLMAYAQMHGGQGGAGPAAAPSAPQAAPGAQQRPGVNPALLAVLSSPWAQRSPMLAQLAMNVAQQQIGGNKLQYQTDGEGNIIALDPSGRRPPTIVHRAAVKPINVPEGGKLVVPDPAAPSGFREVATGGDKGTPDQKNYEAAMKGGFKGSFADYQIALRRASSAQPESSFNVKMAEGQAKQFTEMASEYSAARSDMAGIKSLREQLDRLPGGFAGNAQAMAVRMGIKVGENASAIEAADAILNRLTPAQRQGMPGAASDVDVKMFRGALPSLGQTKEGQKIILDTMQGLAQYKLKQAEIAQQVAMGRMKPEQAFEQLAAIPDPFEQFKAVQGGSVPPGAMPAPSAAPTQPAQGQPTQQQIQDEMRRRGLMK